MKTPRLKLAAALLFPIAVLAGNAYMNHQQRLSGEEVVFPISGFDPRDLLSGNYLVYQVDYGLNDSNGCPASDIAAALCVRPERRIYPADELPDSCTLYLKGDCDGSAVFSAGLNRFYIPQENAKRLEKQVLEKRGQIAISLDSRGNAAIRDLLIDGKPWKQMLEE